MQTQIPYTNSKNMCKNIYVNLRTSSLFCFLPDPRKDAPPEMTSETGQQISTVNSSRRGAAITVKHWPTISRLATHTCSPACRYLEKASNKGSRRFHSHEEDTIIRHKDAIHRKDTIKKQQRKAQSSLSFMIFAPRPNVTYTGSFSKDFFSQGAVNQVFLGLFHQFLY